MIIKSKKELFGWDAEEERVVLLEEARKKLNQTKPIGPKKRLGWGVLFLEWEGFFVPIDTIEIENSTYTIFWNKTIFRRKFDLVVSKEGFTTWGTGKDQVTLCFPVFSQDGKYLSSK